MSVPGALQPDRPVVLWVEHSPVREAFVAECRDRGLAVTAIRPDQLRSLAANARAVVLPVIGDDDSLQMRAQEVIDGAALHGLLVVLLMHVASTKLNEAPTEDEATSFYDAIRPLRRHVGQIWIRKDNASRENATEIQGAQLEPAQNSGLQIDADADVDEESRILLERAFFDKHSLSLERLSAGRSDATTWRVAVHGADSVRRLAHVIAKIAASESINAERSGIRLIEGAVPFRLYAPLLEFRFRQGLTKSIAVYEFLTRSEPLIDRLARTDDRLIDSLFTHTLAELHQSGEQKLGSLTEDLQSARGVIRWCDELRQIADVARDGTRVPGFEELRTLVTRMPPSRYALSTIHGDLHIGNLFVPEQTRDVVLIDYATVTLNAPRICDHACLEVSLAFPPPFLFEANPPDATFELWCRSAFEYPLRRRAVAILTGTHKAICRSIRGIRDAVARDEEDPASYAIAVAAFLLRFASYEDNGSPERRRLAYELAAQLMSEASADLRGRHTPTKRRSRVR